MGEQGHCNGGSKPCRTAKNRMFRVFRRLELATVFGSVAAWRGGGDRLLIAAN